MTTFAGLPLAVKTHPRARRVLVKIIPGKGLSVVTPRGHDSRFIPDILEEKRAWIERTRDRLLAEGYDLSGKPPELPADLEYRCVDRVIHLDYLDRNRPVKLIENSGRLHVSGPLVDRETVFEALRKHTAKKAREALLPLLAAMSCRTGLTYSALRVRCQKTRWGSCSARGTISLNAKLLFLPPPLVDHLLLHELCHTRHLDHSGRYWACVEEFEPDYLRLEESLRRAGKFVPDWFDW